MLYTIYILSNIREAKQLLQLRVFLEHKIQGNLEPSIDFPYIHIMENGDIVFNSLGEVLDYYENNIEYFALYFHNTDLSQILRNFMIFFTEDGHTIIGIDVAVSDLHLMPENDPCISEWTHVLKQYFDSDLILYSYETPPPMNKNEFLEAICDYFALNTNSIKNEFDILIILPSSRFRN